MYTLIVMGVRLFRFILRFIACLLLMLSSLISFLMKKSVVKGKKEPTDIEQSMINQSNEIHLPERRS